MFNKFLMGMFRVVQGFLGCVRDAEGSSSKGFIGSVREWVLEGLLAVNKRVVDDLQWVPGSVVGLQGIFENLQRSWRTFDIVIKRFCVGRRSLKVFQRSFNGHQEV